MLLKLRFLHLYFWGYELLCIGWWDDIYRLSWHILNSLIDKFTFLVIFKVIKYLLLIIILILRREEYRLVWFRFTQGFVFNINFVGNWCNWDRRFKLIMINSILTKLSRWRNCWWYRLFFRSLNLFIRRYSRSIICNNCVGWAFYETIDSVSSRRCLSFQFIIEYILRCLRSLMLKGWEICVIRLLAYFTFQTSFRLKFFVTTLFLLSLLRFLRRVIFRLIRMFLINP